MKQVVFCLLMLFSISMFAFDAPPIHQEDDSFSFHDTADLNSSTYTADNIAYDYLSSEKDKPIAIKIHKLNNHFVELESLSSYIEDNGEFIEFENFKLLIGLKAKNPPDQLEFINPLN